MKMELSTKKKMEPELPAGTKWKKVSGIISMKMDIVRLAGKKSEKTGIISMKMDVVRLVGKKSEKTGIISMKMVSCKLVG